MATEGPNSPGTTGSDSSVGTIDWSTTSNATASDDSYATAAIVGGEVTYYLTCTNFGFSIPSGVTINGIVVEWEKSTGGLASGTTSDNAVRIIKGGAIGATDRSGSDWTGTDTYESYGSSSDLWGETWAFSDINATTFGAAISATNDIGSATCQIDHCRITVYYTSTDPADGVGSFVRSQQAVQQVILHRSSVEYTATPLFAEPSEISLASAQCRTAPPPPPTIRSGVAPGVLEPTLMADLLSPLAWVPKYGNGVKPSPERPRGATAFAPGGTPAEEIPDLGWLQPWVVRPKIDHPVINRSWFVIPWLPGQEGAWPWQPWVAVVGGRFPVWYRGDTETYRGVLHYPTEGPQRQLITIVRPNPAPARSGSTTVTAPPTEELNQYYPSRWGVTQARSVRPQGRGSGAKSAFLELLPADDVIVAPRAIVTHPRHRPGRGSTWFDVPDVDWQTFAAYFTRAHGVQAQYHRPTNQIAFTFEDISTLVVDLDWLRPVMARAAQSVQWPHRAAAQVYELLQTISTAVRKDDRDAKGISTRGQTSTGGSGRAKTSTGVGTGT